MFKINNKNTRTKEGSVVFIVDFELVNLSGEALNNVKGQYVFIVATKTG